METGWWLIESSLKVTFEQKTEESEGGSPMITWEKGRDNDCAKTPKVGMN